MTGGYSKTVEVLKIDGTAWCTLPDLPQDRGQHTQSGLITCGGSGPLQADNCVRFSGGHWKISHNDLRMQFDHCAWSSFTHGTRLIGGFKAEFLADDGRTPDSFSLANYTL